MRLKHLSRLTMLCSIDTKQMALYTVDLITVFLSNGHFFQPLRTSLLTSVCSICAHSLPYFPTFPHFLAWLDTRGVDSGMQPHQAALNVRAEV